jgi:hypothetical protein
MSTTQQPINDGGTAFPSSQYGFVAPDGHTTGMSLRDWFAGMALQGLMAKTNVQYATAAIDARAAYETADAMIEARKKDYIIDRGEDK